MTGNYKFSTNKRRKCLRVLEPSVFIQMPPFDPVQGYSAEWGSCEPTLGSSKLGPSNISWLMTTFEYLNRLCLWAPPLQVPLLACALWVARGDKSGVSWARWSVSCKTWDKKDLKRGALMLRKCHLKLQKHKREWGRWEAHLLLVCVYMPRANVGSLSGIGLITHSLTCVFLFVSKMGITLLNVNLEVKIQ